MTKLVICGQAPSRVGDGRAFSGPSGRRLASLFDLEDYEELASRVTLTNIFPVPAARKPLPPTGKGRGHAGDDFDETTARRLGMLKVKEWAKDPQLVVVLACGAKVYEALTGCEGTKNNKFSGKALKLGPAQGVDVWYFPHPSGASHYWDDPDNVDYASRFLKRLLKHYEISITE